MPDLSVQAAAAQEGTARAVAQADASLEAAGIRIRAVTEDADVDAMVGVFDTVWGMGEARSAIPAEEVRVYRLTGQYLQLAEDAGTHEVLAASLGFFAAPAGTTLHSHITGVLPAGLRRGVGFAVKLHQRAWALECGLRRVTWTFDPLQARNAWFNLAKLGARAQGYLVDVYGAMPDQINAGDASDRIYLEWRVADQHVADRVSGAVSGAATGPDIEALRRSGFAVQVAVDQARPGPSLGPSITDAPGLLVQVPESIDAVRRADAGAARDWRIAVRNALLPALEQGWRVDAARGGWYVLQPGPRDEGAR